MTAASDDGGVLAQGGLDLAGADLVAPGLDQVGGAPADDPDVSAPIAGGHVPGGKPAVAHRLGGRLGPVQVAGEQVGAADLDLADRLVVDARPASAPSSSTRRSGTPGTGGPDGSRRRLSVGPQRGVHQRLGHAVALEHAAAGERVDALVLGSGQRRRARRRAVAPRPAPRPARDRSRRRRRAAGTSSAPRTRRSRRRSREPRGSPPGRSGPVCTAVPPRRSGPRIPTTRPWTWNSGRPWATTSAAVHCPGVGERIEVRGDRPPRQHRALGRPGGARRVDDQGRRLGVVRLGGESPRVRPPGRAAARRDRPRSPAGRPTARRRGRPGGKQQRLGLGVADDVRELARPERGLSGTTGTPARSAARTATAVSIRGSASTATRANPSSAPASAPVARSSSP